MNERVSVIMTTYNRALLLKRAIKSVLAQTFNAYTLYVIDDASGDATVSMIQENFSSLLEKGTLVYHRNDANQERSACRNIGMRLARTEFLAFLDDDDEWLPNHLSQSVDFLELHRNAGMVFSNYLICFDERHRCVAAKRHLATGAGSYYRQLCLKREIGYGSTYVVRKAAVDALGGFREGIEPAEDREFFARVAMNYDVGYIARTSARIHIHPGSFTSKRSGPEHALNKERVWQMIEEDSKKYSYVLSAGVRANNYLYLATFFLPDIAKSREYLDKALAAFPRCWFYRVTWDLLLRIVIAARLYRFLKKARAACINAFRQP
jgi:glycosyltransferase involved in cell wall biosynthesis